MKKNKEYPRIENGCTCSPSMLVETPEGLLWVHSSNCSIGKSLDKECDHIVGFVGNHQHYLMDISTLLDMDHNDASSTIADINDDSTWGVPFYFCPKKGCGKSIDWDAIKKQLNPKKDE